MSDTFKAISEKYQSLALNCPILGKDYIEFDKSKLEYQYLNSYLKSMFSLAKNSPNPLSIYQNLLGLNNLNPLITQEQIYSIEDFVEEQNQYSCMGALYSQNESKRVYVNVGTIERSYGYIKVIVNLDVDELIDFSILDVYFGAVKCLKNFNQGSFQSSISKNNSFEQMVFLVDSSGFEGLCKYFDKYQDSLITPLKFVPTYKQIAISREIVGNESVVSYHQISASIIYDYLVNVKNEEQVALDDFANLFLQRAQGNFEEQSVQDFFRRFVSGQVFYLVMQSLLLSSAQAKLYFDHELLKDARRSSIFEHLRN